MKALVRRAIPSDADRAAEVVRRSIVGCCIADHANRSDAINSWIANKTPENLRQWIGSRGYLVVAEIDGRIVGVGMLGGNGMITLCYVIPEVLRKGVGTALLEELESEALRRGQASIHLQSTVTALPFYQRHGYVEFGEKEEMFGLVSTNMQKELSPKSAQ